MDVELMVIKATDCKLTPREARKHFMSVAESWISII